MSKYIAKRASAAKLIGKKGAACQIVMVETTGPAHKPVATETVVNTTAVRLPVQSNSDIFRRFPDIRGETARFIVATDDSLPDLPLSAILRFAGGDWRVLTLTALAPDGVAIVFDLVAEKVKG